MKQKGITNWLIVQPTEGIEEVEKIAKRCETIVRILNLHPNDKITYYCDGDSSLASLSLDVMRLSNADIVYFAKGWENDKRCAILHSIALQYGIVVVDEEIKPWLTL